MTLNRTHPAIQPPSKVQCPDTHLPIAQSEGTVSRVSIKLVSSQEGSLEKSGQSCVGGPWGFSGGSQL